MNLIELKEQADRWLKMNSMVLSIESEISAIEQMLADQAQGEDVLLNKRLQQMKMIYEKCQADIQELDRDRQEYETAWKEKCNAVKEAGGETWDEIVRINDEISKVEPRVQILTKVLEMVDKEGKTAVEEGLRDLCGEWLMTDDQNQIGEDMIPNLMALRAEEIEKIRSMEEVIQWLVIEA